MDCICASVCVCLQGLWILLYPANKRIYIFVVYFQYAVEFCSSTDVWAVDKHKVKTERQLIATSEATVAESLAAAAAKSSIHIRIGRFDTVKFSIDLCKWPFSDIILECLVNAYIKPTGIKGIKK